MFRTSAARLRRALFLTFTLVLTLVVATALLGVPPAQPPRANAATSSTQNTPMGVYRGAGATGANRLPAYESFLGRPVQFALDFQGTENWANQTWPDWMATPWASSGRTVILGATGIFPGDWNRSYAGTTLGWAQAARGDYDRHWRTLAERLVAKGQSRAILRGAHEFNGGWFPHRVNPGEEKSFVAAWRRWVTVMRSVPGQRFSFDWNPVVGREHLPAPEVAYPGDAYVDRVAVDVYDGWYARGWRPGVDAQPSQAERDEVWNRILKGDRGLIFWRDFSRAHNKPLAIPEWGLRIWKEGDGYSHGGGDNATFIHRMASIIKDPAWNIAYHAFWEDPDFGVSDPDGAGRTIAVPQSRVAFLREFGAGASDSQSGPAPAHYSKWSDRSWGQPLNGALVSDMPHVWVPSAGVTKAEFYLDDDNMTRPPRRVDFEAPFDLVDGNRWWAVPLDARRLSSGGHTLTVKVVANDGAVRTSRSTFTVRNVS